jgi:type IV pilus assembly protein PilB
MVTFDDSFSNKKLTKLHSQEEERYVQAMAPQLGFNYINLQGYTINPAALATVPEHTAQKAQLVAFELKNKVLQVAAKSPSDATTQQVLAQLQKDRYTVEIYMCSTASLEHAWERYKDIKTSTTERKGVFEIDPEEITRLIDGIKRTEDVIRYLKEIRTANNARRITETLQLILAGALALKASDIHIEPEEGGIRLRYRFDGVLHDVVDLEPYMHERMMSRFKLLSGMKLNRSAEAQDGRFTFDLVDKEVEIRSSVIPGALGESIVMRVLDPTVANFSLNKIDMNPIIRKVIESEIKKPNGLILTTGPTGSGKTTVLYAFLRAAHTEGVKIITIENPVEYKIEGIVQTQTDAEYTFASGLRALLRQDPDIIMVGEIRDKEVAETAIHAAQTGHLVFSTLHTNSAVAIFNRLIDLGIDPRFLSTSINLIMGQRLIRLLCNKCKKSRPATDTETNQINQVLADHPQPPHFPTPYTVYDPVGCEHCGNTGFKGRTGVFEAVQMDPAVEEAILRDPREHIILEAAKHQGIPSMAADGITKVLEGKTSIAELARLVELPTVIDTSPVAVTNDPQTTDTKQNTQKSTPDDDFLSHVV